MDIVLRLLKPANALAIRVAIDTGLRIDDVLSLKSKELKQQMYVREQKTGKTRRIYLNNGLFADLMASAGPTWIFSGRLDQSQHRTRQAVWKDVKRAARAMRLRANVSTHSARKMYALELFEKYGDIEAVQKALNHDNPATTAIYLMTAEMFERRRRKPRTTAGRKNTAGVR